MTLADKPLAYRAVAAVVSPLLILVCGVLAIAVAAVLSPVCCIFYPHKVKLRG